jgi:MFS family permease
MPTDLRRTKRVTLGTMCFALFLQDVQGYSPIKAGVLQLPSTLGVMAAAIISGRIVGRIGARLPITIGLLMTGTGLLFLTGIEPNTSYASFWYWLLLVGAPIAYMTVRYTAPHHVEERQRTVAALDAAEEAGV